MSNSHGYRWFPLDTTINPLFDPSYSALPIQKRVFAGNHLPSQIGKYGFQISIIYIIPPMFSSGIIPNNGTNWLYEFISQQKGVMYIKVPI